MNRSLRRLTHRRRGGVAATILIVLAIVCLIGAIAGFFYARNSFGTLKGMLDGFTARMKSGEGIVNVVAPGSVTSELKNGGLLFIAISPDTIDDKSYTYSESVNPQVTITDANDAPIHFERVQGNQPPIQTDKGSVSVLGFAKVPADGSYTIKVATAGDQATALRAVEISDQELTRLMSTAFGMLGGGGAALCGGVGFLLFGLIGIVLMIFGKKRQPQMA